MPLSWEDLAGATLARQFPEATGNVAAAVHAIGAIQTQTARSAFIGLGARFPATTHAAITEAYADGAIVRGSTIRGTVHTASPEHYTVLAEATRVGQHPRWARMLGLDDAALANLWTSIEHRARQWRTPDELREHLEHWLRDHAPEAVPAVADGPGRFLSFAHGALVRRPASGDRWEGQGRPVYATFDLTGPVTLTDVVRLHLSRHGPSSRDDVAWWSGVSPAAVEQGLAALEVVEESGPRGRSYLDLPGAPAARGLPGVRLLPEFDALLCGYDSKARDRFVTPAHHARLWNAANGLLKAPLLVDGRITGYWRATGSAKRRPLEVVWFARSRRPRLAELEAPVAALEAALDITITDVSLTRELV